ncbi:hypothetical protein OAK91_06525 [Planctomycetaceae bacterium]|jgi:hypothetical protein|nr:hypothetical protein [Planctomycetaceae bacterium]
MKFHPLTSVLLLLLVSITLQADTYTIVVSQQTSNDTQWQKVVEALQKKHAGANVVHYDTNVNKALPTLQTQHPRYTCFVATPAEASRQFVADVHQLTRLYDQDPYTDTLWGILTGYDAANALKIAQHSEPLTIRKVASGTEVALGMCQEGLWYDELVQNKQVVKSPNGSPEQQKGPADTTHALANTLTDYKADLFVTSGHATERNWQIGYRYRNGFFRSSRGKMFGETIDKQRFEILSENPKVFLPIGNCLMGHIDGPDAMALAWMNTVGVKQMIGYTVVTWYGYAGWGVLDYFVEQPGRYSLSEAFHVNQHALIHRLETNFDPTEQVVDARSNRSVQLTPNAAGLKSGLTVNDGRGLMWDRDTVAFYGDPAWEARMSPQTKAYDQSLVKAKNTYTFTITPNRGVDSFKPINTNGAQRGWRPIIHLLPHRVRDVQVIEGQESNPVITDDFILISNPRKCDPAKTYRVVFTATVVE